MNDLQCAERSKNRAFELTGDSINSTSPQSQIVDSVFYCRVPFVSEAKYYATRPKHLPDIATKSQPTVIFSGCAPKSLRKLWLRQSQVYNSKPPASHSEQAQILASEPIFALSGRNSHSNSGSFAGQILVPKFRNRTSLVNLW